MPLGYRQDLNMLQTPQDSPLGSFLLAAVGMGLTCYRRLELGRHLLDKPHLQQSSL
jgi:hypothetical protein